MLCDTFDDFFILLTTHVKIIRVPLNNMCYIIPPIYVLSKYFIIEYYYITDDHKYLNESCYQNLIDLGMVSSSNIFYVTKSEFVNLMITTVETNITSILYYVSLRHSYMYSNTISCNIMNKICFSISHGVDEESFLSTNIYKESILDYYLLRAITFSGTPNDSLFEHIYNIDKNKKTIILEDTSFTFCHSLPKDDLLLLQYQNNLIDQLVELKSTYNVVIRFHPQYHHMFLNNGSPIADKIFKNFIISFTQIPLYDQYNKSDIIIFHRCTSSGYQVLFNLNVNMICIDLDFDNRKHSRLHKLSYVSKMTNNDISHLISQKNILHDELIFLQNENDLNLLNIINHIEHNNFSVCDTIKKKRAEHIKKCFNFDILPNLHIPPHIFNKWFMIIILVQIPLLMHLTTSLINILKKEHSSLNIENSYYHLISALHKRYKVSFL